LRANGTPSSGRFPAREGDDHTWISVGYWEGSESLENFGDLTHSAGGPLLDPVQNRVDRERCEKGTLNRLVDASGLKSGDPRFNRTGARIRIHDMYRTNGIGEADPDSLALFVHTSSGVPFQAWAFDMNRASNTSSPTSFDVPVDGTTGLQLSFDVKSSRENGGNFRQELTPMDAGFTGGHIFTRLALDGSFRTPKLRRGVYLVAWSGTGARTEPRWDRYGVELTQPKQETIENDSRGEIHREANSRFSRLIRRGAGGRSERFAYLLMSIDFATEETNRSQTT